MDFETLVQFVERGARGKKRRYDHRSQVVSHSVAERHGRQPARSKHMRDGAVYRRNREVTVAILPFPVNPPGNWHLTPRKAALSNDAEPQFADFTSKFPCFGAEIGSQ